MNIFTYLIGIMLFMLIGSFVCVGRILEVGWGFLCSFVWYAGWAFVLYLVIGAHFEIAMELMK